MLNVLKKLNPWRLSSAAVATLSHARNVVAEAEHRLQDAMNRLEEQRRYIDRLHEALDAIAAQETTKANATVQRMARRAREARE